MPRATTADGVELHWEERGEGPTVILVTYWSMHPTVFEPLIGELVDDHHVVTYDDRGCGESARVGPYDLDTAAADLEVVCEAAGADAALAIAMVDGANKAVRVANQRPDLIDQVIGVGSAPVPREAFADSDSMISSTTVVGAFMQMLENDFRGAMRSMMETTNPQMSADELRERVQMQVDYTPRESAAARCVAWAEDHEAIEPARALGERFTILVGDHVGGGWFPNAAKMEQVYKETFPEALIERIADGLVSAPELTAAVVRTRTRALEETA